MLEIEYIKKYGYYNISDGGTLHTDNLILTKKESRNLIQDLKESKLDYLKISKKYKVSTTLISNINYGNRYFSPTQEYPIRKNIKEKEEYKELLDLLENSFLSFQEISKKLNIGESTVKKINYGKLRRDLWNSSYPIRKKTKSNFIKELLINSNYSRKEISKIANCSLNTVDRINHGQTHKDNNLKYPLRNL